MRKIKLFVSQCLLGDKVRYDGQHKLNLFVRDQLGKEIDYVKVCAEVECGLSVPREPIHLVGDPENPFLITVKSDKDLTIQMQDFIKKRLIELESEDLDGAIFKKDSPSCGLERVKVFGRKGVPQRKGRGMFASAFIKHFPTLPVIEEGMLNDHFLRERFLNRIFIMQHWRELNNKPHSSNELSNFHAINKLLIMSHGANRYSELGRLVENGNYEQYFTKLTELMKLKPTNRKHTNVLLHILGYFKRNLASWEKTEALETIENYRLAKTSILVPLTLLHHYAKKYDSTYLLQQSYWNIKDSYRN